MNAAVALLACVNWFNPAVHVMSRWLRIDQELACDARVVAAYPKARRTYAEAMLKTQLAARPLPLGCHWATHPLAQRVKLLSIPAPSRARRLAGLALTALAGLAGGVAVWAGRPAEIVLTMVDRPAPPALAAPSAAPATAPSPAQRRGRKIETAAVEPPLRPQAPVPAEPEAPVAAPNPQPAPDPRPAPLAGAYKLRIIRAIADRSIVQPGSAVRVMASGVSPDGVPLWADFTAFGSQSIYRKGAYERRGSRYSLFTSVVQDGERLKVTVSLGRAFRPDLTGVIELAPGQTGVLQLPTGTQVVVTATVRPETPDEIEEGRQLTAFHNLFGRSRPLSDGLAS